MKFKLHTSDNCEYWIVDEDNDLVIGKIQNAKLAQVIVDALNNLEAEAPPTLH
tara:strand:- start:291 stop:449 length:159 start_codon:yes stop_codon:yes gene_type:complete